MVQVMAAQSPVTWGTSTKVDKSTQLDEIAFADPDGVVLWRCDIAGTGAIRITSLEAYDLQLRCIAQTVPPAEYQGNLVAGIRIVRLGKVPYLLMIGKKDDKVSLMAWALDRTTLHPVGEPIWLFNLDLIYSKQSLRFVRNIYTIDHHARETTGDNANISDIYLQYAFNADSTGVAIAYINSSQTLQMHVFDQSWKPRWENSFVLEEYLKHIRYNEQALRYQNGVVSMTYALTTTKEQRKQKGKVASGSNLYFSYLFHALLVNDAGKRIRDIVIDLGYDTLVNSLQVLPQPDGSFRCVGTYTLKNKGVASSPGNPLTQDMPPIAGVFQTRLSKDGSVIGKPGKAPLLPMLLKNAASYEKLSKIDYQRKEELLGFRPDRTVSYPDGSVVVIYQSVIVLYEMRKGGDRSYHDLVVVRFAPDGLPVWANVIPKRQATSQWQYLNYGSYGLVQDGELLHFIYMNNAASDATLQLSTLNAQGNVIAARQLARPTPDTPSMPQLGIAVGANFLVPAEHDEHFKLGWIKL